MLISVIIPHLNQPELLEKCIASLHEQSNQRSSIEIIVVDNGSTDTPDDVCQKWPDTRLICEPTPGPGPARNLGISAARGEILAFIDADCTAHPEWINAIETAFETATTNVIGGDVQVPIEEPAKPTLLECYERIYAYRNKEYIASGFSGTGNLAMRPEAHISVGPFGGIDVAEDRDWGLRAKAQGITTAYVDHMIVLHPARKSFHDMHKKWDRHIAHDFSRVNSAGARARWMLRAVAVGLSPAGEIVKVLTSNRVSGIKQRALAFACLVRIRVFRARRMFAVAIKRNGDQMSGAWNRD